MFHCPVPQRSHSKHLITLSKLVLNSKTIHESLPKCLLSVWWNALPIVCHFCPISWEGGWQDRLTSINKEGRHLASGEWQLCCSCWFYLAVEAKPKYYVIEGEGGRVNLITQVFSGEAMTFTCFGSAAMAMKSEELLSKNWAKMFCIELQDFLPWSLVLKYEE